MAFHAIDEHTVYVVLLVLWSLFGTSAFIWCASALPCCCSFCWPKRVRRCLLLLCLVVLVLAILITGLFTSKLPVYIGYARKVYRAEQAIANL